MRQVIAESDLQDTTTKTIDIWLKNFSKALELHADETMVSSYFTKELRKILRDPISGAPINDPLLGGDATYDRESLAVALNKLPPSYRDRSPLDIRNKAPMILEPHPVAQHLIEWLKNHNALFYSADVKNEYLRLSPKQQNLPLLPPEERILASLSTNEEKQAKINEILARTAALNLDEAQTRREATSAFNEKLDEMRASFKKRLAGIIEPFKQQVEANASENGSKLNEMAERGKKEAEEIREFVAEARAADVIAISAATEQSELVFAKNLSLFEESKRELASVIDEGNASLARMERLIEKDLQQAFAPIIQKVEAYAQKTIERISAIAASDKKTVDQLEQVIRVLDKEIVQLEEGTQNLIASQKNVAEQLSVVKLEQAALEQGITETRLAIRRMEKRNAHNIWSTVAIVAGCSFATWAIQSAITAAGSSCGVGLIPTPSGGGQLAVVCAI
jgi:hypothetical protein